MEKGRKLNWRQACEILGCSKRHFYRLVHSGELSAYRTSRAKRGLWVFERDVRALVKKVQVDV